MNSENGLSFSERAQELAHEVLHYHISAVLYELSSMGLAQLYDRGEKDWISMTEEAYQFTNSIVDKWTEKLKEHGQYQLVSWIQRIQLNGNYLEKCPPETQPQLGSFIHTLDDINEEIRSDDDDDDDDVVSPTSSKEMVIPFHVLSEMGDLNPCQISSSFTAPSILLKQTKLNLQTNAIQQLKENPSYWVYPLHIIDQASKVVTQRLHHVTLTGRKRKLEESSTNESNNDNNIHAQELVLKSIHSNNNENTSQIPLSFIYARKMQSKQKQKQKMNNLPKVIHNNNNKRGRPPCSREFCNQTWEWEKDVLTVFPSMKDRLELETLMIHNDTKDYHHVIQGALKDLDKQQQKRKRKRTKKETTRVHWGAQVEFELGDCYLDFSLSDQQRYVPMAFRSLQVFLTNNDLQEDERDDDNS